MHRAALEWRSSKENGDATAAEREGQDIRRKLERYQAPLLMVISRARQEHLEEVRDVLIEYGADYGVEERRRYQSRCDSDEYDPIYLREFHKSATSYLF